MDLNGKVVIVTGATRGIGKAIAMAMAKEHANLALCAKYPSGLNQLYTELIEITEDEKLLCRSVDVSHAGQVEGFVYETIEQYGRIDILINNAAIIKPALLHEMSEEDWELVIDTNLKGPFLTMKYVIPFMKEHKSGQIINICSMLSKTALAEYSAHCAAKFGLRGLSLSVKEELRKEGIQLSIINPGTVNTEMWNEIPGNYDRSKMIQPDEIANLIVFMLKNANNSTFDEIDISSRVDIGF